MSDIRRMKGNVSMVAVVVIRSPPLREMKAKDKSDIGKEESGR